MDIVNHDPTATPSVTVDSLGEVDGQRVGAYQNLHGAALAAEQLIENGFPPDDIHIVPSELRTLPDGPDHMRHHVHGLPMIIGSTTVFVATSLLLTAAAGWTPTSAWMLGLVTAIVVGGMCWWLEMTLSSARRRSARVERQVIAERFDVFCERETRRVERMLARWWNPDAVPASNVDSGHPSSI